MNTQNSLIPQGSALEQKTKGRARVKVAVFFVLAIHGIGLMAFLLMQGCGQSKEAAAPTEPAVTTTPQLMVETNTPPVTTSTPPVVVTAPVMPIETPVPPVIPAGATAYASVQGDTFGTLHRKSTRLNS